MSTTLCCCMRLKTFGVFTGGLGVILNLPIIGVLLMEIFESLPGINFHYWDLLVVLYFLARAICCLTSIMLVVGTVKERHRLVLPWLINSGVILSIDPLFIFKLLEKTSYDEDDMINPFYLFIGIAFYVFEWYMHTGIYSLYYKIKESTKIQGTRLQPETGVTILHPDSFKTEAGP